MNHFPSHGAPPPQRPRDLFWVEQLAGGERQRWRIYSPSVWGVWTHYEDATSPCYENHKFCVNGHDPKTLRWKGYVLGWSFKDNKIAFVQLTATAIETWTAQLGEGVSLRGQMIYVARTVKAKGRLSVSVEEYQCNDGKTLPADADPRKSLYHLWGLNDPGHKWATNPERGDSPRFFGKIG